jgi:hypothetical protein
MTMARLGLFPIWASLYLPPPSEILAAAGRQMPRATWA